MLWSFSYPIFNTRCSSVLVSLVWWKSSGKRGWDFGDGVDGGNNGGNEDDGDHDNSDDVCCEGDKDHNMAASCCAWVTGAPPIHQTQVGIKSISTIWIKLNSFNHKIQSQIKANIYNCVLYNCSEFKYKQKSKEALIQLIGSNEPQIQFKINISMN